MMLPFRTYDIPGAMVSGFLILAACEAGYDGRWLIDQEWSPERISRYGLIALCIGFLVAAVSRRVIEDTLIAGWLGRPEEFLLGGDTVGPRDWRRALFPGYCAPLGQETREWLLGASAARRGAGRSGECIDDAGAAVGDDRAAQRAPNVTFHLYTTCRTLCLGLLAVSAILASGIVWHAADSGWGQAEWRKLGYGLLSLFEAAGMLYRYLKYYRQLAIELLILRSGVGRM